MPSRECNPPNRYLLAIFGLLAIMAISITLAVMFPYVDYNAQQAAEMENVEVTTTSDSVASGVGGVVGDNAGGGAIVVDDAAINEMASDAVSQPDSVVDEKVEDAAVTYTNGAVSEQPVVEGAVPSAVESVEKVSCE